MSNKKNDRAVAVFDELSGFMLESIAGSMNEEQVKEDAGFTALLLLYAATRRQEWAKGVLAACQPIMHGSLLLDVAIQNVIKRVQP